MNDKRTRAAATVLIFAMALGAVAVQAASKHAIRFTANLEGAAEVPAVSSEGKGTVSATLNAAHDKLNWRVTYSGLSGPVVAAHFHGPAAIGTSAGVAIPLSGALTSPIEGEAMLTPAQADELLAGKWYLNLHTAAHANGEVRGQVLQKR